LPQAARRCTQGGLRPIDKSAQVVGEQLSDLQGIPGSRVREFRKKVLRASLIGFTAGCKLLL
jgi:hypothetical protein